MSQRGPEAAAVAAGLLQFLLSWSGVAAAEPEGAAPGPDQVEAPAVVNGGASPLSSEQREAQRLQAETGLYQALVEYRTAWSRGYGFLLGDQRTVVVLSRIRDTGRRITVRLHGSTGESVEVAEVQVRRHGRHPARFHVLRLAADLPGRPLVLADDEAELGDEVFVLLRRRGRSWLRSQRFHAAEVAVATVTAAAPNTLAVGAAEAVVVQGSPLFDPSGRVVAFWGTTGLAYRAHPLLDDARLRRCGRCPSGRCWASRSAAARG